MAPMHEASKTLTLSAQERLADIVELLSEKFTGEIRLSCTDGGIAEYEVIEKGSHRKRRLTSAPGRT